MNWFWSIFCIFVVKQYRVDSANILGIFPHPGKSHFDVFQVLMEELAVRGHNVTVVSFFPHPSPPKGYHDISLKGLQEPFVHVISFEKFENPPPKLWDNVMNLAQLYEMGVDSCNALLPSPQFQSLLTRNDFDLAIIEQFNTDCFLGVVHKLHVPFIGFSSCTLMPWHFGRIGNPSNPAYIPNIFFSEEEMTFLNRLYNSVLYFTTTNIYSLLFNRIAQNLAERHIGDIPPLEEIAKNTSLMFLNTHYSIHKSKPLVPALIEIGGLHVKPANPLPRDLEDFIGGAKDGVILVSFGSMLIPETMSQPKIKAFLNAFRRIPQRVIWKINAEKVNLSSKDIPENLKIMGWLPQRDILAHKNVKAFIAHGGLLGLTEAIMSETPVIAVPMYGDQPTNVRAAVRAGFAVKLEYKDITEESLLNALGQVLSEEYQTRAYQITRQFLDRPVQPLELAVYWTEYILRYGGASLRSEAVDLSITAYYLIDVGIVVLASALFVVYIIGKLVRKLNKVCRRHPEKEKKL